MSVLIAPSPRRSDRRATSRRYLMCPPTHFDVAYAINPWMDPSKPTDRDRAVRQWNDLRDTYRRLGHDVEVLAPVDLSELRRAGGGPKCCTMELRPYRPGAGHAVG